MSHVNLLASFLQIRFIKHKHQTRFSKHRALLFIHSNRIGTQCRPVTPHIQAGAVCCVPNTCCVGARARSVQHRSLVSSSKVVARYSSAPLSFVFHAECTAHVPSWLPRSPSCELASDCLVAHLLPRQWHSLAACPRHVCVRAGPLLTSGLAMFVARQPIAEVVARLSRGRATTWLFL